MAKFCPACGVEALPTDKFCKNCGRSLESEIIDVNSSVVSSTTEKDTNFQQNTNQQNTNQNKTNYQNNSQMIYFNQKSPGIALLLSFLVWGLGYAYIDNIGMFITYLVIEVVLVFLSIITLGFGLIVMLIVFIYQLYAVYRDTEKFNMKQQMMYQNMR